MVVVSKQERKMKLYYKKKGKRLDFDTEGRLMSVNKIRYY